MDQNEKTAIAKQLYGKINDYFLKEYMDVDNGRNLDEKIEVMEALLAGKKPYQIEHYDDVMDKYPQKETFVHGSVADILDRK